MGAFHAKELASMLIVSIITGIIGSVGTYILLQAPNNLHKLGFAFILGAFTLIIYGILYLCLSKGMLDDWVEIFSKFRKDILFLIWLILSLIFLVLALLCFVI